MVGSYWKSNFEYNFVLNQFWIFCSPALKQMCLWWTSWNALFIHFNIKCMRAWLHLYETVAVSAFSWSFLCHRVSPSWYYCFQTEQRQGKQLRQCCQGLGILRWEKIYLSTVRTISLKINLGGGGGWHAFIFFSWWGFNELNSVSGDWFGNFLATGGMTIKKLIAVHTFQIIFNGISWAYSINSQDFEIY